MVVWLFDIDGTLIGGGGAGQSATFVAVSQAFGIEVNGEGIRFAGRTDRAIAADVFTLNGIPNTESNWLLFRDAYLRALSRSLVKRQGRILDGVTPLLDRIALGSRAHLGLLTGNMRDGAYAKLTHHGLWDRFHFGGFGDHHESRDLVAQAALESAIAHLGTTVEPSDVWVVGDTPDDVTCARAIGANVIAVSTGGHSVEELADAQPDRLLTSLADLSQLADLTV